jgi:hypothetical protein
MARDAQIDVTAKTVAHVANRENSMSGQDKIPQELSALNSSMARLVPGGPLVWSGYFCSRINVGAIPESVENPDGPTAVSQLEQPCTLPR